MEDSVGFNVWTVTDTPCPQCGEMLYTDGRIRVCRLCRFNSRYDKRFSRLSKGIWRMQRAVRELREALMGKWPHPPPFDSWAFTVTELAEVGDILLRMDLLGKKKYVRNNEKPSTREDLARELGDVMLMLATLANHFDIDLACALRGRIDFLACKYGEQIFYGGDVHEDRKV